MRQARRPDPRRVVAHARSLIAQGQTQAARAALEHLLVYAPDCVEATSLLATLGGSWPPPRPRPRWRRFVPRLLTEDGRGSLGSRAVRWFVLLSGLYKMLYGLAQVVHVLIVYVNDGKDGQVFARTPNPLATYLFFSGEHWVPVGEALTSWGLYALVGLGFMALAAYVPFRRP